MKRFFLPIWDFILYHLPIPLKGEKCDVPSAEESFIYFRTRLLQKIEPVINSQELTDTQKIEKLKKMIENYDPLEY